MHCEFTIKILWILSASSGGGSNNRRSIGLGSQGDPHICLKIESWFSLVNLRDLLKRAKLVLLPSLNQQSVTTSVVYRGVCFILIIPLCYMYPKYWHLWFRTHFQGYQTCDSKFDLLFMDLFLKIWTFMCPVV